MATAVQLLSLLAATPFLYLPYHLCSQCFGNTKTSLSSAFSITLTILLLNPH